MLAAPRQFDVIVLGAGAAGLMCAATAGQRGRRVVVLDHNGQVGRKILISGGGRCNFTNLHCGPQNFLSNNSHFAKSALAIYQPAEFNEVGEGYGIPWHEKTLGQLFCDGSARAIVEMLLAECEAGGVEIVLNTREISVERAAAGRFQVQTSAGKFEAESLVVATGGLSIPKLGATGLGYELARQFGLGVIELRPALVPLLLGGDEAGWMKLAGVSAEAVAWVEAANEKHSSGAKAHASFAGSMARLKSCPDASSLSERIFPQSEKRDFSQTVKPALFKEKKAVLFREKMLVTHRGLSGPAVLQASSYWRPGDALVLDFASGSVQSHPSRKNKDAARVGHPDSARMGHGAVEAGFLGALREAGARRDLSTVKQALRAALPQRLADFLAESSGAEGWTNAALQAREIELHRWSLHPVGTEGFEKAEVTAGGVDTAELQAKTMEARAVPGLFFIGEVVDVTGQLGGFNFQWAWASGVAAGRAV